MHSLLEQTASTGKSRYEPVHLRARVIMNHYKVDMSHPEVDMSHHKVIMSQSHYEPLHWSVVIISNLPFSLTMSRGEYLRVVGILEMVEWIYIKFATPLKIISEITNKTLLGWIITTSGVDHNDFWGGS